MRKLKNCQAIESTMGPHGSARITSNSVEYIMLNSSHCFGDLMILPLATLSLSIKTLTKPHDFLLSIS